MIDLSDGLVSDLQHICTASNVGAKLLVDKIPLNLNLPKLHESFNDQLELALNGGEDFQLLFTLPKENVPELTGNMFGGNDDGVFKVIGEITSNVGIIELKIGDEVHILQPKGYQHF